MKNIEIKNLFLCKLFSAYFLSFAFVFGMTTTSIPQQTAQVKSSNNADVIFSHSNSHMTYYSNSWDDSTVIGNTLTWYYFDTVHGIFKPDWSENSTDNVRIIAPTSRCSSWYGYKFSWKAKSQYAWYIDFAHASNKFVYYCVEEWKLYGEAYSSLVGFHRFDGIAFNIIPSLNQQVEKVENNQVFENDQSNIDQWEITPFELQNELIEWSESLFYIIK